MWVRGLKPGLTNTTNRVNSVAPYVGAWIETNRRDYAAGAHLVAPYVGAWIETGTFANIYDAKGRTLCGCVD